MEHNVRPRSGQRGFGLLEVLIGTGVLLSGLFTYGSITLSAHQGVDASTERAKALEAARAQLELIRSVPFDECLAAFDETTENDPSFAPGPRFHVSGLRPANGDADRVCGRVTFPTVPADDSVPAEGPALELREDVQNSDLGMPRDLDGDGVIDDKPKNNCYQQLPVAIEVRWAGALGEQVVRLRTVLSPWRTER